MTLPEAKPAPWQPEGLEYGRTLSYIFDNPNWLMNLVWLFLCWVMANVIPILPQIVSTGYQFEVLNGLLASQGARYPDFDINRILDYLMRGLWAALAAVIVFFVWLMFFAAFVVCAVLALVALGNSGGEDSVGIGVTAAVGIGILLVVVLAVIATPAMLAAGMTSDLGAGLSLAWIGDFVAKMWLNIILASLFSTIVCLAIIVLTCGLGLLVVFPIASFMSTHFYYQFYVLYLARGGRPLPIKGTAIGAVLA